MIFVRLHSPISWGAYCVAWCPHAIRQESEVQHVCLLNVTWNPLPHPQVVPHLVRISNADAVLSCSSCANARRRSGRTAIL